LVSDSTFQAFLFLITFRRKNPHFVLPAKPKDKAEAKKRRARGILQVDAASESKASWTDNPGYPQGAPYATPPQNRYQRWLRKGMDEDEPVIGHYTRRFVANLIEA
jgi:DNA (cytosine-5)-methyltransferase 1